MAKKTETKTRRTPKEIAAQASTIWHRLKKTGPQRAEALKKHFNMTSEALAAPLRLLGKNKQLKVSGVTRATEYTAVGRPPG